MYFPILFIIGWLKCVQALEVIGLIAIICVGFLIFMQFFCTQSIAIKIWGIMLMIFAGRYMIYLSCTVKQNLNTTFLHYGIIYFKLTKYLYLCIMWLQNLSVIVFLSNVELGLSLSATIYRTTIYRWYIDI
jgi:hypothetical protein